MMNRLRVCILQKTTHMPCAFSPFPTTARLPLLRPTPRGFAVGAPRMSNAQKKMQKLRHLAQGKVFSMQRAKPLTFEPHMLKESNTKFGTRNGATFVKSASKVSQMELDGKEVAFAGRSNVGKSSLLNALMENELARTSKTPGRTQLINIFNVGMNANIVDLPGYGFAKAPTHIVDKWNVMMGEYLRERWESGNLCRVLVLIDSRRGVMDADIEFLMFLAEYGVQYQIVLTKVDKLTANKVNDMLSATTSTLTSLLAHEECSPFIHAVSSEKNIGLPELRHSIMSTLSETEPVLIEEEDEIEFQV